MRSFVDVGGRSWDVVLGRESWGRIVAIFVPRDGGADLRETVVAATGYEDGEQVLEGMDEEGLRALLERSTPKEMGGG